MLSLLLHKHDLLCGVALPVLTQVVTFKVILMLERPIALQAAERPRGGVSPLDVLLHHGYELGLVAAALAEEPLPVGRAGDLRYQVHRQTCNGGRSRSVGGEH